MLHIKLKESKLGNVLGIFIQKMVYLECVYLFLTGSFLISINDLNHLTPGKSYRIISCNSKPVLDKRAVVSVGKVLPTLLFVF